MPNQMFTIDDIAALGRVSRATVRNRMGLYDDAIAMRAVPPAGSLRSTLWFGRRLVAEEWLRESMGLDVPPEPTVPPRKKCAPRGKPFQRRETPDIPEKDRDNDSSRARHRNDLS